jgi:PAS domain S-box-containing protein
MTQVTRHPRFPASVRGAILWLTVLVLAPLLLVQAIIYAAWYRSRWSDQEAATLDTAREAATTFGAYIRDVHRQETAIGAALAGPHHYTTDEANHFLNSAGHGYSSITSWSWTDAAGKVIASTRKKKIGSNLGDQTYFQELRKGRTWAVSDLLVERETGNHVFVIASRISNQKDSLSGVVVAVADVTDLGERAVALFHPVGEAIALFDRQGTLVFGTEHQFEFFADWRQLDPLLAEALHSGEPKAGVVQLAAEGKTRQKYLAARVPVANVGWIAGARRPVAKAMAGVYTGLWVAAGLNVLVAIVSALFAWRTGGNLIGQLNRLQSHAQAIGRGDFGHPAEGGGLRELADLASAFNRMGAAVGTAQLSLAEANAALEQRVAQRTAELNKTTEALRAEQQRFRDVLDVLPAYVVLLTQDYHVPFANRFFRERFGESHGQRCYEYLFHRNAPCETCETFTVLKTKTPHRWEWIGPDGRNYDVHDFPFTDADGSMLILEMGIDVTERKRAEAAVRAVGAYNRRLIEASLDPLVTIGPDGKITDVNAATEQTTGVPRDELIGSDFTDYFTEPQQAEAGYQRVLAEGQVRDYPLTIRHVSGQTTDVLYNASVYRDDAGQVVGVFAAARDVTERKRAEAELEKYRHHLEELVQQRTGELEAAHAQLRAVFDVVNVGMLLIDEQGVVKRVNDTVSRWFGKGLTPSLDSRPGDVITCIHALADPAGCGSTPYCRECSIRNAFQSVLRTGQPVHDVEAAAVVSLDGQETHLWVEVSADPLLLEGTRHVILAMNNITARKQAEEAMERLASFPRLNPNPIVEVDLEGRVHYVNPTAQRLFPDLQQAGLAHPWLADWESVAMPLREGDTAVRVREVLVDERYYQQTIHYVQQTERVRLYGLDITDRKQAEESLKHTAEQLTRSNQELEQFAYVASHDLQEPLRVVGGYVQLIERKYKQQFDANADEFFRYIVEGVQRMQQLITDLLNYSRIGTRSKPFSPTNMRTVIDRVLANLKAVVDESGATVTYDSLPTVRGDETQLVQLFQNLVGNGIKFHGELPPRIDVSARRDGNQWEFTVRDNGIGIERQYWEQIFEIFQRLHTRQKYAGTGIGLAICKRIVERHGGRIWLDSQPGQGTAFLFTLP